MTKIQTASLERGIKTMATREHSDSEMSETSSSSELGANFSIDSSPMTVRSTATSKKAPVTPTAEDPSRTRDVPMTPKKTDKGDLPKLDHLNPRVRKRRRKKYSLDP